MAKTAKEQATLPMEPTERERAEQHGIPALRDTVPTVPTVPGILSAESLIAKAIDANVPIETMERLLAMRDRLKAEQAKEQFFAALSAFQSECPIIPKTKTGGGQQYTYKYAPMDTILTTVQPLLAKHGLSHTIKSEFTDTHVVAVCQVHHVGGHTESSSFKAPIEKTARMNDIQKTATARTYAMRYAFCDAHGIVTGDEDTDAQTPNGAGAKSVLKVDPTADVARIKELAEAKGIPLGVILQHYEIDALDDLTAEQRTDAVDRLKKAKTKVDA